MSSDLRQVLVWGHSFVKRLYADLERGFHPRARSDFDLERPDMLLCLVMVAALSLSFGLTIFRLFLSHPRT